MTKRKSPRLYIPLDARFFDDDKILKAGERAAWLFLAILTTIKLDNADGMISHRKIARLGIQGYPQRLQKLQTIGLILEMESDELDEIMYLVPSWSRWNLLSYEVEARREMGREYAQKRWSKRETGMGNPMGDPMGTPMQREGKINKEKGDDLTTIGSLVENFVGNAARESFRDENFR